jgi:predicted transcriptional regulator
MNTQTLKQDALETLQRLPENADIEEIMYRLYVLENIRRGKNDAEQGNSTDAEQLLKDIQTW